MSRSRSDSLAKTLHWRGTPQCSCRHAYRELGRRLGVPMGSGWVRVDTDPDCPHHGGDAR